MPAASASAAAASAGKPAALSPRALYQEVADRLREKIFARELEPGSWIDELKLAAEWGISRTPLREALKVLAVEGLVTMKVRRGAYVTEMSRDDVSQVYRLLALLESDAAGEVATSASDAQIAELRTLHDQLEKQARQRDAFFATNERFHFKLLEVAGNRWRSQIVADLRKVMKLNRHHSLFKQGRISESLAEHRTLMRAIERRDAERACRLMREHFERGLEAATAA
jgi:DNA-binding GntR family transcriptional regulator